MKYLSMKTKMALATSLLFMLVIVLLAWGSLCYQERSLKKAISQQQLAMVSSLAANIDDKLGLAHKALITAARQMPAEDLHNIDRAQHFLDARISLLSVFDNGLFLISSDGNLIAESPFLPGRRGIPLISREFVRQTFATGKPYISKPYTSTHTPGHPAIFLSAPIFNGKGRLLAILGGSFDLWGTNFLEDLSHTMYGDASYFYLTDRDRNIIVHPDRSRTLTKKFPEGDDSLYEKALNGFEGSEETVNFQGNRVITSIRHLRTTGWILASNYPAAEAYAPLKTAREYFLLATVAFSIVVLAITWLLMRRLAAPLAAFTRHVESLPRDFGRHHLLEINSRDEIGIMAQSFNRMVTTLETQQAAYRRLYNETPVMLHSIDQDGLLVSVSNFWLDTLGYERSEVLGRRISEFFTEESRRYAEDVILPEFFRTGFCKEVPYGVVKKNGEILDVLLSSTADKSNDGRIVRSLTVMIDVTERKQAQEEIERLNSGLAARAIELENANKELEAFSYTVSHDLRKPLTAINGFCQLILDSCGKELRADCYDYLQEIVKGAQRMNELIDALLKLSCVTRNELRRETVELGGIAHAVAEELARTEPERRVAFRIASGISINGDMKLLRVVLENLLGNAWKYTAGCENAVIEFGMADIGGNASCFIRDNGTGFPMEYAEKLFIPFHRLPGSDRFKGHGIGLATVERIIRRHGGRIWAEGEPGKGATFWFTL